MSNNIVDILHCPIGQPMRDEVAAVLPDAMLEEALACISQWAGYQMTPLHTLPLLAQQCGVGQVFYKDESTRFNLNSFKALGAAFAVQQLGHNKNNGKAVVASATDGNHGRSLAWGAQQAGCEAKIFIHAQVSEERAAAIAQYGAEVIRVSGNYDDSVRECEVQAKKNNWQVISDTSWEGYTDVPKWVMAGYTVIVAELAKQMTQPPTHVFLQAGVGAFAAAMVAAIWKYFATLPIIVIVESELANCLMLSAQSQQMTTKTIEQETVMAGLSCGEPSLIAWQILEKTAAHYITISDEAVGATMHRLANGDFGVKVVAGECAAAGAVALQGMTAQQRQSMNLNEESRVLLFGSEGITDEAMYRQLIGEGI